MRDNQKYKPIYNHFICDTPHSRGDCDHCGTPIKRGMRYYFKICDLTVVLCYRCGLRDKKKRKGERMKKKVDLPRELRFILELCKELKEQAKLIEICAKDTLKKIQEEKAVK